VPYRGGVIEFLETVEPELRDPLPLRDRMGT